MLKPGKPKWFEKIKNIFFSFGILYLALENKFTIRTEKLRHFHQKTSFLFENQNICDNLCPTLPLFFPSLLIEYILLIEAVFDSLNHTAVYIFYKIHLIILVLLFMLKLSKNQHA